MQRGYLGCIKHLKLAAYRSCRLGSLPISYIGWSELARRSRETPNRPLYSFGGNTDISAREFERACHRAARLICREARPGEVVAVASVYDFIVGAATVAGLMVAGLVPFPIAPQMPPSSIVHLLRSSGAHRIIISNKTLPALKGQLIAELEQTDPAYKVDFEDIPPLDSLYPVLGQDSEDEPGFEMLAVQPQPIDKVGIILHSSGTTALPKPLRQSHAYMSATGRTWFVQEIMRLTNGQASLAGMQFVPFHLFGIGLGLLGTVYSGWRINVFPPTDGAPPIPTPEAVLKEMILTQSNVLFTMPSFFQVWASQPTAIDSLKQLKAALYTSGPLAQHVGDQLVREGVPLRTFYAASEFGVPVTLRPPTATSYDWNWVEFPKGIPVKWVKDDTELGLYEFTILNSNVLPLAELDLPGDGQGYASKDLFEKHPIKEGLWRLASRKDDILIHLNGNKTVPGPMEDIIKSHPMIRGALMFGHQRERPCIIVDPQPDQSIDVSDPKAVADFKKAIWPTIARANESARAHSKVYKDMILIVSREKPLTYTMKGTVSRRVVLSLYEKEIDDLYNRANTAASAKALQPPTEWTEENIRFWMTALVKELLHLESDPEPDRDLFEQDLDSFGAISLRMQVLDALKKSGRTVNNFLDESIVYSHPTINALVYSVL